MDEKEEKKNKKIGLITSIGIHAGLVILFILMMAWRAPNPPLPEYGIELNFGLDSQGSGEVQPETPPNESETIEEQQSSEENVEKTEEAVEEVSPEVTQVTEQPVSKIESPVSVTEVKKESKPVPKVEEKTKEKKQPEVVKAEEKLLATYPADGKKEEGTAKANHGDNPNTVGDRGSKEGSLDAKALYGKQGGGGGGPALDLAGWNWDQIPNPAIPNNESDGKIEFEIKVDENGDIIGYRVLERSLSIDAEKACRDAISKLTFTKKAGAVVPAVSVGKITFVVRTR
jgi:outer membrane biosynthesis protein TonB